MNQRPEITQKDVLDDFSYNNGSLFWNSRASQMKVGDLAGSVSSRGYRQIRYKDRIIMAHRLIFLFHHGYMPDLIDHIDRDRSNNKIENLRPATKRQNAFNSASHKDSISKFKGVTFDKRKKKWMAQIFHNQKNKFLGYFLNEELAYAAYKAAAVEIHGEFICV